MVDRNSPAYKTGQVIGTMIGKTLKYAIIPIVATVAGYWYGTAPSPRPGPKP